MYDRSEKGNQALFGMDRDHALYITALGFFFFSPSVKAYAALFLSFLRSVSLLQHPVFLLKTD